MNSKFNQEFNLIIDKLKYFIFNEKLKNDPNLKFNFLSKNEILKSFNLISECKELIKLNFIPFIYDYEILNELKELEKGRYLNIIQIKKIKEFILNSKNIRLKYNEIKLSNSSFNILNILKNIFPQSYILDKINSIFDDYFKFKKSASKNYESLIDKKEIIVNKIDLTLNNLKGKISKLLVDNITYSKDGKKVLLVKIDQKNLFKGNVIKLAQSGKGVYIEPIEIAYLNNEIVIVDEEIKKEEEKLVKEINKVIFENLTNLKNNYFIQKEIDLIYAKSKFSIQYNLNEINLSNDKEIILKDAFHILIKKEKIVKINFNFYKDKKLFLLTGPNAGGKSVAFKTVAIIFMLCKMGLHVPASSDSKIYLFDNLYMDIENQESLIQSLSSFSGQIKNVIEIINNAKENDLVILDELGSGTDPQEGSAIAISILEYLTKINIKVICSTHFDKVKNYAFNNKDFFLASVLFDLKTLKPKYTICENIIGDANAILIAENFGLKKEIVLNAKKEYENNKSKSEINLSNLSDLNLKLSDFKKELIKKEQNLISKELNLAKEKNDFEKKLKDIYDNKTKNAKNEYLKQKQLLEKELEKIKKEISLSKFASAKNLVNRKVQINNELDNTVLNAEDSVYIIPYAQNGIVKEIKKNKYLVSFKNLILEFDRDELKKIKKDNYNLEKKEINDNYKKKLENKKISKLSLDKVNNNYIQELDLRGFYGIDVEDEISKAISSCIISNQKVLKIIVGFGTGVVRNETIKYLKKDKYVKNFQVANYNEGGPGSIIVNLK